MNHWMGTEETKALAKKARRQESKKVIREAMFA
jgi:hypothetical protein